MSPVRKRLSIDELCEDSDSSIEFKAVPIEGLLNPHSCATQTKRKRRPRPTFMELVEAVNKARQTAENATGPLLKPIKVLIPEYDEPAGSDRPSSPVTASVQRHKFDSAPANLHNYEAKMYQSRPPYPYISSVYTGDDSPCHIPSKAPIPLRPSMRQNVAVLQHRNSFPPHNTQLSYHESTRFRPLAIPHSRLNQNLQMDKTFLVGNYSHDLIPQTTRNMNQMFCAGGLAIYPLETPSEIHIPAVVAEQHMAPYNMMRFADSPLQPLDGFNNSLRPQGHGF